MADELVTVELNGHQFQVKVPKGSDDAYVSKAATDYHAARYPNEAGVSVKPPNISQNPQVQKDVNEARPDNPVNQGFLSSAKNAFSELGQGMIRNPGSFLGPVPSTETGTPADFAHHIRDIPGEGTFNKAIHGNIAGAAGDILPAGLMALISSPKARGAVEGAVKSIGPTAENISQNASPVSKAAGRAVGTGAGFKLGGYPGAAAGAMAGGELGPVLLHPIEMAKGMGQGAIEGGAGKPIIPNFMDQPQTRLPGNATPEPETPFGRGGLRVNAGPAESGEYFRDKNAPLPQVQRPNNVIQMPGPQEYFRDRNALMPRIEPPLNSTGIAGTKFNSSPAQGSSSPVTFEEIKNYKLPSVKPPTMPKIVEQQVSPALKSVDEPLPGEQLEEVKEEAPPIKSKSPIGPKTQAALDKVKKVDFKPAEKIATTVKAPKTDSRMDELNKLVPTKGLSADTKVKSSSPKVEAPKSKSLKPPLKKTEPNVVTSPEETKPHFTHELLGNIAKHISGNNPETKITMTEVGRYIHENELGTYQPSKFGEGKFGAGRNTKSGSTAPISGTKATLIKEGISDYIKKFPEKF